MDSIKNNTSIITLVTSDIYNSNLNRISTVIQETMINKFSQANTTSTLYTNNIINHTILNKSNVIEKSIIIPPISDNLINSIFNHIETTSLQNNSFIKNDNNNIITNVSDITYSNETHILNSIFESNNNKTNNKNKQEDLINDGNLTDDIMTNNKNNQSNIINNIQTNSYDRITLILGIIFPLIFILFIIYLIYCCIKRKKKLNMLDHNDLNKIKLKTSGSKVSYKKIQNTSNNNIINPNNISMSEIKVQNIKSESIISRSSGSSSSSRRKREKNINAKENNMIMGEEGRKEVQNEIKEQIKQIVINDNNKNY